MANQSKTEDLYIIMEPGFESVCGFDPANVVTYKPYYAKGTTARAYRCYKTKGAIGSNRKYWNMIRRQAQQETRDARCMVRSPKTGRLIRCEKKCAGCPAFLNGDIVKEKNRPASTEYIAENGLEATNGDVGSSYARRSVNGSLVESMEEGVLDRVLLDALIEKANSLSAKHGEIFKMMLDGETQQAIADKLNMKQRTVADWVKVIRKTLAPILK